MLWCVDCRAHVGGSQGTATFGGGISAYGAGIAASGGGLGDNLAPGRRTPVLCLSATREVLCAL